MSKNKHMPCKLVKFNKYKHKKSAWITLGLLKSIRYRDKLYKQLRLSNPNSLHYDTLKLNLKTYNLILRKSIISAKQMYYESRFNRIGNDIRRMLCTAGQTGCLPWLAVVCMYHRRRSCRIAYGRHHVIVCVQSCVCSEGEHTLHISCCFGGRRQISLRLLY